MKTTQTSLYDALLQYSKTDAYPFHMPGHKRRLGSMEDPFSFDITEIDGFDNLHHPEGILKEAQERAAALYGAKEAFYLVNGSTAGILAAISAAIHDADAGRGSGGTCRAEDMKKTPEILFARNAHKSAFHALYLNRVRPVWLYPEAGGGDEQAACGLINGKADPAQVEQLLKEHPQAAAVFVTSPTYDGVVSDIRAIADTAHRSGIPLVVDQAHGAHFGLHPDLPESASRLGADLVITSLHKTLPSLTQTGLLLLGGNLIRPETVRRFLSVYQTSSPSYVLMAGMDSCIGMMRRHGREIFGGILSWAEKLRESAKGWHHVKLLQADDPTKILISAGGGLSGKRICDILRQRFHIEAEMALPGYVLCLAGAGDDPAGFERLTEALTRIDEMADEDYTDAAQAAHLQSRIAEVISGKAACEEVMPIYEAWDAACESVPLSRSKERVCGDFAYLYPPGIPLVIPGERIGPEAAWLLGAAEQAGYELNGMADLSGQNIRVLL